MIDVLIPSMLGGENLNLLISQLVRQGFNKEKIFIIKDGHHPLWKDVPSSLNIIQTKKRLGFAGACDFGIRNSNSDHVLLLNDDLSVSEGFFDSLNRYKSFEPFVGFRILNKKGTHVEFDGGGMNVFGYGLSLNCGKKLFSKDNSETLFACGACSLMDRKSYEKAGGFCTDFFCYFEDAEFGWRANRLGFKTFFVRDNDISICHAGQHTSGRESGFRERMMERNSFLSLLLNIPSNILSEYLSLAWSFSKVRESESQKMGFSEIANGCWYSRRNISRYIEKISELRNFSDLNEYSFKKTRHLLEDPVNPAFPKMISKKLLERVYQLWF